MAGAKAVDRICYYRKAHQSHRLPAVSARRQNVPLRGVKSSGRYLPDSVTSS